MIFCNKFKFKKEAICVNYLENISSDPANIVERDLRGTITKNKLHKFKLFEYSCSLPGIKIKCHSSGRYMLYLTLRPY